MYRNSMEKQAIKTVKKKEKKTKRLILLSLDPIHGSELRVY